MSLRLDPARLEGVWRLGWALDFHTISSEFLGYDDAGNARFDTRRTDLGELVYRLKYRGDLEALEGIAKAVADFLSTKPVTLSRVDIVVPVPSSTERAAQPVMAIAKRVAELLVKPFLGGAVRKTRETPQLKTIDDPDERQEILEGAFSVDKASVFNKGVLLVDDLFRSGATANTVTRALYAAGAARVYFVAITRTRIRK
jgi:predicted amidophosphoribosyltransferase